MKKQSLPSMTVSTQVIAVNFLLSFLLFIVITPLEAQQKNSRANIDEISLSVVQISSPGGRGSGSIVDGSVYIITNRHTVEGYYDFDIHVLKDVTMPVEPAYKARLVSFSADYDFALLRIVSDINGNPVQEQDDKILGEDGRFRFPALSFLGSADIVRRGDNTGLLGYPGIGGAELVYTTGTISSVSYDEFLGTRLPVWYRTNADMAPGNSGGIAINEQGQVIGIPTFVITESQTGGRLGSILSIQVIDAVLGSDRMLSSWDDYESDKSHTDGSGQLSFDLPPTYGDIRLGNTMGAEPFTVEVIAGGSIDASYLGSECVGFVAQAPDYRLFWEGDISALLVSFEPHSAGHDPTLVINTPGGSWLCNDDFGDESLSPLLMLENPQQGQYDIWVGSYEEDTYIEGNLYIIDLLAFSETIETSDTGFTHEASLDYELEPTYGIESLEEGFTPDPFEVPVISGGSIAVEMFSLGMDCLGYASEAPDYRLHWTGSTSDLRITFIPDTPGDDTVLIINTSEGIWICNDDAHGETVNPEILLRGIPEGQFDIWVASYDEDTYHAGKLIITEL